MQLILFLVTKAIVCLSKDEKVAVNIEQMRLKLEGTYMLMSIQMSYRMHKQKKKRKIAGSEATSKHCEDNINLLAGY